MGKIGLFYLLYAEDRALLPIICGRELIAAALLQAELAGLQGQVAEGSAREGALCDQAEQLARQLAAANAQVLLR
jgi:hypothetical protein